MKRRALSFFVGLVGLALSSTMLANEEGAQVVVNYDTREVTPTRPYVNVWQRDAAAAISIRTKEGRTVQSFPDVDIYELRGRGLVGPQQPQPRSGGDVMLRFRRCDTDIFRKYNVPARTEMCPFAVQHPEGRFANTWTIYSGPEVVSLVIDVYDPAQPGEYLYAADGTVQLEACESHEKGSLICSPTSGGSGGLTCVPADLTCVDRKRKVRDPRGKHLGTYSPEIYVAQKPFKLQWAGGFSVFGEGDERFRIGSGDAGERTILAAPEASGDLRIAALANLVPYDYEWIGVTAGLATDGELEDLSLLLGGSVRLRTLPIVNDLYLTLGAAYAPVDRLKSAFTLGAAAPEDLTAEDLVEAHREVMPFFSLSFGFWGSREKFDALGGPR